MTPSTTNTAAREAVPSNDHLRLHLGEMTAQEMRTAKAAYRLALTETITQQQGGEQEAGALHVLVEADTWEAASFIFGSSADGFCDAELFIGEHTDDDGKVGYGLLIGSADYPDEGVVPLADLPRQTTPPHHPADERGVARDAARWRAIRHLGKNMKLYVYDDQEDPCSGDWVYDPNPELVDAVADAALQAGTP